MSIVVRSPTFGDVPELARINVDTWRDAYAGIVPDSRLQMNVDQYVERWRENLDNGPPGVEFLVADLDGVVAGYAIVGPYRPQPEADAEDTASWGELFAIYVDPPRQDRGAGKALHDTALDRLRERSYERVALWVLTANVPAVVWYERQGWVPDGTTGSYQTAGTSLPEVRLQRLV